jgi:hypothetical protein
MRLSTAKPRLVGALRARSSSNPRPNSRRPTMLPTAPIQPGTTRPTAAVKPSPRRPRGAVLPGPRQAGGGGYAHCAPSLPSLRNAVACARAANPPGALPPPPPPAARSGPRIAAPAAPRRKAAAARRLRSIHSAPNEHQTAFGVALNARPAGGQSKPSGGGVRRCAASVARHADQAGRAGRGGEAGPCQTRKRGRLGYPRRPAAGGPLSGPGKVRTAPAGARLRSVPVHPGPENGRRGTRSGSAIWGREGRPDHSHSSHSHCSPLSPRCRSRAGPAVAVTAVPASHRGPPHGPESPDPVTAVTARQPTR